MKIEMTRAGRDRAHIVENLILLKLLLLLCLNGPALAQNQVLELDGDSSYVRLPGSIFDAYEEATVEAWVKWEDWN